MLDEASSGASEPLKIPLNELPSWSPWPARIVGLEHWSVPNRNLDKIKAEYNDDKYRMLLDWVEKQEGPVSFADAERALMQMLKLSPDKQVCISRRQELFVTTVKEAFRNQFDALRSQLDLAINGCQSLVELGCGAGFNLWYLRQAFSHLEFSGGDFSLNAVAIARRLGQNVVQFNFCDAGTYSLIERSREPVAILTSHALEQLPSAAPFLENLTRYRQRIRTVINFEPVRELHAKNLLGLLRFRYTEINDYNRDLLSVLRSAAVEIDRVDYDVIGVNPLNPTSAIQWHFR